MDYKKILQNQKEANMLGDVYSKFISVLTKYSMRNPQISEEIEQLINATDAAWCEFLIPHLEEVSEESRKARAEIKEKIENYTYSLVEE